jgi:hypothetical protein
MGVYASMLFVLGMIDRLGEVASVENDNVGIALEEERLPKRIRLKRPEQIHDRHPGLALPTLAFGVPRRLLGEAVTMQTPKLGLP